MPPFPAESHSKCTWTPPEGCNQTLSKKKGITNLFHNEKLAIKRLRCNKTIIIKAADKGRAIVVMNNEDYIKEAERQLHDEQYYAKLTQDPSNAFKRSQNACSESFIQVDQDRISKLIPQDPQPGKFYLLPKIHKPNNPGCPIVSNKLILTAKISQYVEFYLKPYAQNANSFIQDITDSLNKLKNVSNLPNNIMLVTLDV